VFTARPPARQPVRRDLHLARAAHRTFTGPAEFLTDAANRARVGEYLADMARPHGRQLRAALFGDPPSAELGHSYGEMAKALIESAVPADEPVDLLILAFSVHDLWPGRPAAAYLSHLTPGAPMAFAVCDQGSAAGFTGLRIARAYASSAGAGRALLIAVEQAALPYDCPVPLPSQHRGVAMLYSDGAGPRARVADLRQHPAVRPSDVTALAAADLKEMTAGHDEVALVLGDALAAIWTAPAAGRVRVAPPGQPATGVWCELVDELDSDTGGTDLLVAADYDPDLRYLCLTALEL
jgi:predicted naringenin-chalcone synthase